MRRYALLGLLISSCLLPDVTMRENANGVGGSAGRTGSGGNGNTGNGTSAGSSSETAGAVNLGGDDATGGTPSPGGVGNTGGRAGSSSEDAGQAGVDAGGAGGSEPTVKYYQVTGSWPKRPVAFATKTGTLSYTKVAVHTRYLATSCAIGDYNGDAKPDISSGRYWYEGPDFKAAHTFRDGHDDLPRNGDAVEIDTGISDDYSDFAFDMNDDGNVDIINISNPDVNDAKVPNPQPAPQTHATAYWYENPGAPANAGAKVAWAPHLIHSDVRLEAHTFSDVDGDGKPEFSGACKGCTPAQTKGYYYANWQTPNAIWQYRAVTQNYVFPFGGTGWLHGIGFGDVNDDGAMDLLERGGAWLDISAPAPNTQTCPAAGCGWDKTSFYDAVAGDNRGPSQMFAFDVDGDGDQDVVAADWAHGYGLAWYEQTAAHTYVRRQFMGSSSTDDIAKYGPVAFSEPHSMEVADMDGDGVPDLITGKMRFAHPLAYSDPDPNGAPVLYVFKTKRNTPSAANGGSVTFEPHLVDSTVGVGTQLAVGHLDANGILDLCVASKVGLTVFLGQ